MQKPVSYTHLDVYKRQGEFVRGKPHGEGGYFWPDGRTYCGSWEKGRKCGQGTMTYPDGRVYTGGWKKDLFHGEGTMKFPDGSVQSLSLIHI